MSDIIYNPPASGGGGTTINPTNNFIPVRSNATTFIDSFLRNTTIELNSQYLGVKRGINLDFSNKLYSFGDYNLATNGTMFEVDENTQKVYTKNINEPRGIYIDFATRKYLYGDWNNFYNGTSIYVDDNNEYIQTRTNGSVKGINLDFLNNNYIFGSLTNGSIFTIDANNVYAQITLASIQYMLLDQLNGTYWFGDYAGGQGLQWNNGNNEFILLQQGFEYIYLGNQTNFFGNRFSQLSYKIDYNSAILSIGDNAYVINETLFVVDLSQEIICTQTLGNRKGLLIDFANTDYKFGDFNAVNKGTYIYIEDANNTTHFYTQILDFNGGNLESGSSSGSSGKHLVITLNGNVYKIDLKNP